MRQRPKKTTLLWDHCARLWPDDVLSPSAGLGPVQCDGPVTDWSAPGGTLTDAAHSSVRPGEPRHTHTHTHTLSFIGAVERRQYDGDVNIDDDPVDGEVGQNSPEPGTW